MHYSLNEIEQMCRKASRGWGLPWGSSDEAGKAISCLHCNRINGCAAFSRFLSSYDHVVGEGYTAIHRQGVWKPKRKAISPIFLGLTVNDFIQSMTQSQAQKVIYPVLLLGFLLSGSKSHNHVINVGWANTQTRVYKNVLTTIDNQADLDIELAETLSINVVQHAADDGMKKIQSGCLHEVSEGIFKTINHYAQKTYVEATEQSRQRGAGAGLVDSD